ncbi:MAG: hypothetical protein AAF513_19035 [Pseudomonadota bacterium]
MSDTGTHYGRATATLIDETFAAGVERAVLLQRHSARTFDRSIHDLLNPLTDHGRALCRQFGELLPRDIALRGYASPPERCMETAQLTIEAHVARGGMGHRVRAVEALGVFYALDQQRMWKGLSAADSLAHYIGQWYAGEVGADVLIPAPQALQLLLGVLVARLDAPALHTDTRQLDLCVSHDFTVLAVRHGLGLEAWDGLGIEFLDGLLLFRRAGELVMRSQHGAEVQVRIE